MASEGSGNSAGYSTLYSLENALRELIVERLAEVVGARWWRQRVPHAIREKAEAGKAYERSQAWQERVVYHPIYYIDFPDLRTVIESKDNWSDCFSALFGRKDHTLATLSAVEPARNRIAHCRRCTKQDGRALATATALLESAVGSERMSELVARQTLFADGEEAIAGFVTWITSTCEAITRHDKLEVEWDENLVPDWLLGEALADYELALADEFIELARKYTSLPSGVGSALAVRNWPHHERVRTIQDQFAAGSTFGRDS